MPTNVLLGELVESEWGLVETLWGPSRDMFHCAHWR